MFQTEDKRKLSLLYILICLVWSQAVISVTNIAFKLQLIVPINCMDTVH